MYRRLFSAWFELLLFFFLAVSSYMPFVRGVELLPLDLGLFSDAGNSCATASRLDPFPGIEGSVLPGTAGGRIDSEDWYALSLQDNWKIDVSAFVNESNATFSLEIHGPSCSLRQSTVVAGQGSVNSILNLITNESGLWYIRLYPLQSSRATPYYLAFRVYRDFFGGAMVNSFHLQGDRINIAAWVGTGDDPIIYTLNESFRVTVMHDRDYFFQALGQNLSRYDAIVIKDVGSTMNKTLESVETSELMDRVAKGASLFLLDPMLIQKSESSMIGTLFSVRQLEDSANMTISSNRVTTYGVNGLKLNSAGPNFIIQANSSRSQILGTYEADQGEACARIDYGNGTLIALGMETSNLEPGSVRALGAFISTIITNLNYVSATLSTPHVQIKSPQSPYLAVLAPSDATQEARDSVANMLQSKGLSVTYSNLMYSDGLGKYFASMSLTGPRILFNEIFKTKLEPTLAGENGGLTFRNEISIVIPTYIVPYSTLSFSLRPDQLDGSWPPPANPVPQPPKLSPNEAGRADMGAAASVEGLLNAYSVRQTWALNGGGVGVAVVDTGFHVLTHSFYTMYPLFAQALQDGRIHLDKGSDVYEDPSVDTDGHGTAIFSDLISTAPAANFYLVKAQQISNALQRVLSLPVSVLSLSLAAGSELSVSQQCGGRWSPGEGCIDDEINSEWSLVKTLNGNGVTLIGAGGNGGALAWPQSMSEFLSIGGVRWDGSLFKASNYASSGNSRFNPNRHVPDVSGLVGPATYGIYIQMPTQPGSSLDVELNSEGDGTAPDDGWIVASGTSSAAPQTAGMAALVKQLRGASADNAFIKTRIMTTATDIMQGTSASGESAGPGTDAATGAGLINFQGALWTYTLTVQSYDANSNYYPVPGATVSITRSSDGVLVATLVTDSQGIAKFYLGSGTFTQSIAAGPCYYRSSSTLTLTSDNALTKTLRPKCI